MADSSGPLTKEEVAACLQQPGAGTKVKLSFVYFVHRKLLI